MNQDQIIRAWKDEDYRSTLSSTELSALPENPAGLVELNDRDIFAVNGQEEAVTPSLVLATLIAVGIPIGSVAVSVIVGSVANGSCQFYTYGKC
jgi:mersacidin/lichenicidin family type 2 lantibiotic